MILTIAILMVMLPYSQSLRALMNDGFLLGNTSYSDYKNATGGELVNAALRKRVRLDVGMNCKEPIQITGIRTFPTNVPITSGTSNTGSIRFVQCKDACGSTTPTPTLTSTPTSSPTSTQSSISNTTPADSRTKLENGQNVIIENMANATYLMSISIKRVPDGQNDFLTYGFETLGGTQFVATLKVIFSQSDQTLKLAVTNGSPRVEVSLDMSGQNHIAAMTDGNLSATGLSILLNGTVIYSQANMIAKSINLVANSTVFDYQIDDWKVFDGHLTSKELYMSANNLEDIDVSPADHCNCPQGYPIFDRWSHTNSNHWKGISCSSVARDKKQLRIDKDSHIPQFATDGDEDNYWVSAKDEFISKLTVDLGTTYQIFYAELTVLTVPKHFAITKKKEGSDVEELLFVATDNCSAIPVELPPGRAMTCKDSTVVFKSASSRIFGSILLNWGSSILFPGLHPNYTAFNTAFNLGKFEAQSVSIYMFGHEAQADVHTVNELKIFGSCGCSTEGRCSLSNHGPDSIGDSGVSGAVRSRISRAATIPEEPIGSVIEVNLGFTFEQTYGFSCECADGHEGTLCGGCDIFAYATAEGCRPCNCGVGAFNKTCDTQGQCFCETTDIAKPELVNKQCKPYVHSLIPSFGPVAGGTKMFARGQWLSHVGYIYVGSRKCFPFQDSSHNDTHFPCETEKVNVPDVLPVYTEGIVSVVDFTYKPDPNITVILRVEVTESGGVDIPIEGTNLDSIADPKISVTVVCRSTQEEIETLLGDCKTLSSEKMNCVSPDFRAALVDVICNPISERKKRAVDDNFQLYDFLVGFVLDGVEEFTKASDSPWLEKSSKISVRVDPQLYSFDDDDKVRSLESDQRLEISGENMESGVTIEDYHIKVGKGECKPILLYNNLIKCELPEELPEVDVDYLENPYDSKKRIPAVVVNIGNIAEQVGYVVREPESQPWIVVVIAVVVVVVVLIIIIVVAVFCIRKKRRTKIKRLRNSAKLSSRYVAGPHGKGGYMVQDSYLDPEHMEKLKDRLIPLDHLQLEDALGQGQFGKVFAGSLQMKSGVTKKVAVKTMRADSLRTDAQAVPNFLQEAILMKDFDHPNVLSLIGVVLNEENIPWVIIPLMSKGDLKHVLRDDKEDFTIGDLLHFGQQAAYGMAYLAKKRFIHRDLAARNCMVDGQYMVKIADFGLSHDIYAEDYYRTQDKTKPLPVKWMAIESLTTGRYTVESDVWSFGILLWETITRGESPYPGVNNYDIKDFLKIGRRLDKPDYCPEEVYDLMCACWEITPTDRPKFSEICEILTAFMNKNSDYSRHTTSQIDDDYLVQHSEEDDIPIYTNQSPDDCPPPDYDVAEPAFNAPKSPATPNIEYSMAEDFNKSNNNSNRPHASSSRPPGRPPTDEYLQPVSSIKEKSSAKPVPKPRSESTKSSKYKPSSEQKPDNRRGLEYVGRKLATQQERSKPNNYLHVY